MKLFIIVLGRIWKAKYSESLRRKTIGTVKCQPVAEGYVGIAGISVMSFLLKGESGWYVTVQTSAGKKT